MSESAAERAARITKDLWRADNYNTGEETDAALLAVEIRAAEQAATRAAFEVVARWHEAEGAKLTGEWKEAEDGRFRYKRRADAIRALAAEVKDG